MRVVSMWRSMTQTISPFLPYWATQALTTDAALSHLYGLSHSGGGSNLQAIIDAIKDGRLRAKIVAVISNRKDAFGLQRAEREGIPTLYFPLKPYKDAGKSREEYDVDLGKRVAEFQPDFIVLAGFMHIVTASFIDQFPKQIINLHPALPGQFNGVNAIQRAYEANQKGEITFTGVMIHYVIPEVDMGEPILTKEVHFQDGESLADFETRMHKAEHVIIVDALAKLLH